MGKCNGNDSLKNYVLCNIGNICNLNNTAEKGRDYLMTVRERCKKIANRSGIKETICNTTLTIKSRQHMPAFFIKVLFLLL